MDEINGAILAEKIKDMDIQMENQIVKNVLLNNVRKNVQNLFLIKKHISHFQLDMIQE